MNSASNRYRLGKVLGSGGGTEVRLAEDLLEGRTVAVKIIVEQGNHRRVLMERLAREAATMKRLSHPNLVQILEVAADGSWMGMELVEGGSLGARVREQGPISPKRALQLVLQALRALSFVHRAGWIHRDVKPDNLLIDGNGGCKLADFGIALGKEDPPMLTPDGAVGSVPFMAPEQRDSAAAVDGRADLYSMGATLYFLLTASTPIDLSMAAPTSPRFGGLSEPMVALIRRAVHADLGRRFTDADAMAEAVLECMSTSSEQIAHLPSPQDVRPLAERIVTADGTESDGDLALLEAQLRQDLDREDVQIQRKNKTRNARWSIGFAITLFGLLVAIFGRMSIDSWVDREQNRHLVPSYPVTGTWKGTVGSLEGELILRGPDDKLSGTFVWKDASGAHSDLVRGKVWEGKLVLEAGQGKYRAILQHANRLDGTYITVTNREPFHLVRVSSR